MTIPTIGLIANEIVRNNFSQVIKIIGNNTNRIFIQNPNTLTQNKPARNFRLSKSILFYLCFPKKEMLANWKFTKT